MSPDSSVGKESTCNAGDPGSIPGPGRSSGEGEGYPLQYSRLENSMGCIVHGVTKSQTWLSDFHFCEWFTIQITFDSYSLIVKKIFLKIEGFTKFLIFKLFHSKVHICSKLCSHFSSSLANPVNSHLWDLGRRSKIHQHHIYWHHKIWHFLQDF